MKAGWSRSWTAMAVSAVALAACTPAARAQGIRSPQAAVVLPAAVVRQQALTDRFITEYKQARDLASTEKLSEAIALMDRLAGQCEAELADAAQHSAGLGQGSRQAAAAERERLVIGRFVSLARLAQANVELIAGQRSEAAWVEAYRAELARSPAAEDALEEACELMREDLGKDRLLALFRGNIDPVTNAVLANALLMNDAPDEKAAKEDLTDFYEELIAGTVDTTVVCENLLIRYIHRLDRLNASDDANRYLDQLIATVPALEVAGRAAGLRLAGATAGERDTLLAVWWSEYRSLKLGRMVRTAYANRLARAGRSLEALSVLDVQGKLRQAAPETWAQELVAACCAGPDMAKLATFAEARTAEERDRIQSEAMEAASAVCHYFLSASRGGRAAAEAEALRGQWLPTNAVCLRIAAELAGRTPQESAIPPSDAEALNRDDLLRQVGELLAKGEAAVIQGRLAALPGAVQKAASPAVSAREPGFRGALALAQAAALHRAGKDDQAVHLLEGVIVSPHATPNLLGQARRQMVHLLLDQPEVKLDAVRGHLDELQAMPGGEDQDVQNLQIRFALRRLMTEKPERRLARWQEEQAVVRPGVRWTPVLFSDLGKLKNSCGPDHGFYLRVLSDLVAQVPESSSMLHLQLLRTGTLTGAHDWPAFRPAAQLALAMSVAQAAGPFDTLRQLEEQARVAETPAEELAWLASLRQTLLDSPQVSLWTSLPVDAGLSEAVSRRVLPGAAGKSHRCEAYLKLFVGQADGALGAIVDALAEAPASVDSVCTVVDDVAVLASACEGRLLAGTLVMKALAADGSPASESGLTLRILRERLTQQPTPSDQAGQGTSAFAAQPLTQRQWLLEIAARRSSSRTLGWALAAMDRRSSEELLCCAAAGLAAQPTESAVEAAADRLFGDCLSQQNGPAAEVRLGYLENLAGKLGRDSAAGRRLEYRRVAYRRQQRMPAVRAWFEAGDYEQCLSALDTLDRELPMASGAGDLASGLLRATALAKLGRDEESLKLLGQMRQWPGSPEEQAQCLLMMAVIQLRADDRAAASRTLGQLVQEHPGSAAAIKAKELLKTLE